MKVLIKTCSLALALMGMMVTQVFAHADTEAEKSKTYSKSYPVGSGDKINLNNSFGEMKISTWPKNEIRVDVSITVKAGSDEEAQRILDAVKIEDSKSGNDISFKTNFDYNRDKNKDNNHNNHNTSFRINYTVQLPANASLSATNQFGPMEIGDFDGPASLASKFGSLTAGKLSQPQKVAVSFGKATIESIHGGKLAIQFSRAQINHLSGEINADFNQSHGIKIPLESDLAKLTLKNNFGRLYLDVAPDFSGSFDIATTFGSVENKSDIGLKKDSDDDNSHRYFNKNQHYTGKSGSGAVPVSIKSNFGNILIGHNLPFDVNEKEKDKVKAPKKTRV